MEIKELLWPWGAIREIRSQFENLERIIRGLEEERDVARELVDELAPILAGIDADREYRSAEVGRLVARIEALEAREKELIELLIAPKKTPESPMVEKSTNPSWEDTDREAEAREEMEREIQLAAERVASDPLIFQTLEYQSSQGLTGEVEEEILARARNLKVREGYEKETSPPEGV